MYRTCRPVGVAGAIVDIVYTVRLSRVQLRDKRQHLECAFGS